MDENISKNPLSMSVEDIKSLFDNKLSPQMENALRTGGTEPVHYGLDTERDYKMLPYKPRWTEI